MMLTEDRWTHAQNGIKWLFLSYFFGLLLYGASGIAAGLIAGFAYRIAHDFGSNTFIFDVSCVCVFTVACGAIYFEVCGARAPWQTRHFARMQKMATQPRTALVLVRNLLLFASGANIMFNATYSTFERSRLIIFTAALMAIESATHLVISLVRNDHVWLRYVVGFVTAVVCLRLKVAESE